MTKEGVLPGRAVEERRRKVVNRRRGLRKGEWRKSEAKRMGRDAVNRDGIGDVVRVGKGRGSKGQKGVMLMTEGMTAWWRQTRIHKSAV